MVTATFWFWCVLICSILSVISITVGFFIPTTRRDELRENLIGGGVIGVLACGLLGWGIIFSIGDAREVYIPIPSKKIEVYKTPVNYVVDFDKEKNQTYTDLGDCHLLDQKDSLYFYKKVIFNYYNIPCEEYFLFKRKPIETEREEN